MAKKRIITIVAILMAIAGAFVVLHIVENLDDDFVAPEPIERIFVLGDESGDAPSAQTVQVNNEFGSFTIVNVNPDEEFPPEFTLEGFEDYDLQGSRLIQIANSARSLIASEILFEEDANLAELGLTNPSATITIDYVDGTSAVLLIGDVAPGGDGAYAMRQGDSVVYLIPSNVAESFWRRDLDLLSLSITETPEEMPEIRRAVLGGSVRTEPIVIEEMPVEEDAPFVLATHLIVSPVQNRLNATLGLESLIFSYGLQADKIEARFESAEELEAWGLDEPYSTLEIVSTTHESFKLMVSAPDEYGMVYLIRENHSLVYRLNSQFILWLELTYFEMMDKFLVLPFIDSISLLEIHLPEDTINITLEGEGQELEVFVNGALYEAGEGVDSVGNFRTLYQDFLMLRYESIPDEPMSPDAPILLQFTYHYRDGSPPDTVTVFEGAARRVYVQLNDETPMFGLSSFVDHLYRSIQSFLEGEQVISYL